MDHAHDREFLEEIGSALDWWRDAGVDCDYVDAPRDWLASDPEAERAALHHMEAAKPFFASAPSAADAQAGGAQPPTCLLPEHLPATLADFAPWWLAEPGLDNGPVSSRIAPGGPANAAMMILVEAPEPDDRTHLLGGPHGRLLDAVLAAGGMKREDIYIASALPRADPAPDWRDAQARGLGQVLLHQVKLVAPQRLLVLGGNVLSLLGHESTQRSAVLRSFNHEGMTIPLLAAWGLASLHDRASAKARFWQAWLEWTAD